MYRKKEYEAITREIEKIYDMIIEIFDDISDKNIHLHLELKKRNKMYNDCFLGEWERIFGDIKYHIILKEELLNKIDVCNIYYNLVNKKKGILNKDISLITTKK